MKRVALLLAVLAACAEPQTPAGRCRSQAALARSGRMMGGRQSAEADALEQMRCDELERQERTERRVASREAAMAAEERERQLAVVRAAPTSPELGATIAEVRVLCERQGGVLAVEPSGPFVCRVGGVSVFLGAVADGGYVVRVETLYEGADLVTERRRIEAQLGPAERETVSSEGFRVFVWASGRFTLSMYDKGVKVSRAR